ncbi:MAG TPA: DUF29 domain-containing protein [Cyanobacteria bacterium UBA11149]|nr:DUF29 domain-containing protein [Cyanobacteria bacterium UBA11367]HBE56327.1 DUF29 domain-containing protein [Cyanobacteria bacterium UBA11366]HBK63479.1 DUF29 domain-containing protein [Cyanobacteria bacterium UBA11166]HBR76423.1 DUF29 domain-containing protein [Cyanobacteria bacterium UBA11159]HBS68438.1 DUF29 domain-containing protein [Cyanobacteria bacterium UBA11153]HBW91542.1 DUF29 domain-containing protein [Cyanobacteria bacterium UBA11149]HCA95667.1 DUF29 domain-containing protein 
MTAQSSQLFQTLYENDYYLWLDTTVRKLRCADFDTVDWENLIEEIESMGRSEKRALASLLTRLFEHLLKLSYWESERENNANNWKGEITAFRLQIKKLLKDSPSLKPYLNEIFQECYLDSRKVISQLTGQNLANFPPQPIATIQQVWDENWFPDNKSESTQ